MERRRRSGNRFCSKELEGGKPPLRLGGRSTRETVHRRVAKERSRRQKSQFRLGGITLFRSKVRELDPSQELAFWHVRGKTERSCRVFLCAKSERKQELAAALQSIGILKGRRRTQGGTRARPMRNNAAQGRARNLLARARLAHADPSHKDLR